MAYKQTWMDNPEDGGSDPIQKERHIASNIASNMSGPGIGDLVAEKRANLLHAQGEPQIGRREPPEPYDPRPRRIMYAKGLIAGALVVLIVVAIVLILGSGATLG